MKYKRCIICRKKAVWHGGQKEVFYFCQEHSEKWGEYLHPRLKSGKPGWRKQWRELMDKFIKLEKKKV